MRVWNRFVRRRKKELQKTHLFRIWGHRIFENLLWRLDKRSIAGGLSLGLFVAFMPTIGFQMILVTFGAIYFKVSLPIALAACWVTNPFTAFPIYTAAWQLGKYVLEDFVPLKSIVELYGIQGRTVRVILHGLYLWTGSMIFSVVSAIIANIAVRAFWGLAAKIPMLHSDKDDQEKEDE